MQRGIVVDTIGLDMPGNHSLSQLINGAYMSGDNPQSLTEAVTKAIAEIGFGDGRDTSEEAFEEIGEIPESFAMATILGLTTYSNHPIGQLTPQAIETSPPVASTGGQQRQNQGQNNQGQQNQGQPSAQNAPIAEQEPDGPGIIWIVFVVLGIMWVFSLFKKALNRHGR